MNEFTVDVIQKLEAVNDGTHIGDTAWTVALKKALIDVAEKYDLSVNCSIYDEHYKHNENAEWLYDAIIYSWKNDVFDEVYLVGESEWSRNFADIKWDFEKLLFARAKVRLLVYQVSGEFYAEYRDKLIHIVENSGSCQKGDVFLFAVFNTTTNGFKVEHYTRTNPSVMPRL